MTPSMSAKLDYINAHKHHFVRRDHEWHLAEDFAARKLSPMRRAAEGLAYMLGYEQPAFLPDERIAFIRTIKQIPDLYTEAEMAELRKHATYHEKGCVFNISPDYASLITVGFAAKRSEILLRLETAREQNDAEGIEFLSCALTSIDAVRDLVARYRAAALHQGLNDIAETLAVVPEYPAQTFLQALQFLRILHYVLWCEGEYHNGLGRFDQYMMPFLAADLAAGRLTEESALDLLEEFFLSFNRDSDLYIGVQQGDNGQSLMLGGVDSQGNDAENLLTHLALKASCELKLIDPKINLRINARTSMELLTEASELTKQGLGFPQYNNDDVVIPALVNYGYDLEDARNYTVAACWEFIIPGVGMDLDNIAAVSLPAAVNKVLHASAATTFDDFMSEVSRQLVAEADAIQASLSCVKILPGPFVSTMCTGCIDRARDVSCGSKYNNFGIHGTGIATAVDSLMAIKQLVFEQQKVSLKDFATIVDNNFEGHADLLAAARNEVPKMGNDIDAVDDIATQLLDAFADSWQGRKNCRGGIYRAGCGSAMYYIWHAGELPASPDGRLKDQPFPANYAPSLNVPVEGPLSVIKSFTKQHLSRVCNGGPLTIELHDSMFREPGATRNVAQLIHYFAERGGHQLQLNAVNRDTLLDAQAHPELHKQLIVRVWGWSGYFVELDKPYQDHVIKRVEMIV